MWLFMRNGVATSGLVAMLEGLCVPSESVVVRQGVRHREKEKEKIIS
jgi:hypothetical protein